MVLVRHVAYHNKFGILLGKDKQGLVWSKVGTMLTGEEKAPTFTDRQDLELWSNINGVSIPAATELREVWPRFGTEAGMEEITAAGLPR